MPLYVCGFLGELPRQLPMKLREVMKPLPVRASLRQYANQTERLLKAFRIGDPNVIRSIRRFHPRLPGRVDTNDRNTVTPADIRKAGVTTADARDIIARWHGFENWVSLKAHLQDLRRKSSVVLPFELAVEAIVNGNVATLKKLLRHHPELSRARSTRYHHASLLHYTAANGVEDFHQKTPANAVRIARLLLDAGAEVDADLDYGSHGRKLYPERSGSTTLGMAATSVHPVIAGVQLDLLKLLIDAGASVNGLPGCWTPVIAALHNGRGKAAEFLARHGANLDLEGAAGVGRLDVVRTFFNRDKSLKRPATKRQMETGFSWACEYGHQNVVEFLLEMGIDVAAKPHGETGLHWASYGGHAEIVKLLLKHAAPLDIKDERFGATPLGWALHGWCYPSPEAIHPNYYTSVALLIKAGSKFDPARDVNKAQSKKLKADPRMARILKF
jgi:ankyrin repeat protein